MKSWLIIAIILHLVGLTVVILNKTVDGWMTNEFFTAIGLGVYWIFGRRK